MLNRPCFVCGKTACELDRGLCWVCGEWLAAFIRIKEGETGWGWGDPRYWHSFWADYSSVRCA